MAVASRPWRSSPSRRTSGAASPLALILIGFLAQWVSWARIDRAAFQYHYYTSLPFVIIALAYFVAEVWHGASRRTWLLARVAAAVGVMGPVILWLLRLPLCAHRRRRVGQPGLAGVQRQPGQPRRDARRRARWCSILLVGGAILVWQLVDLSRPRADGRPLGVRDAQGVARHGRSSSWRSRC